MEAKKGSGKAYWALNHIQKNSTASKPQKPTTSMYSSHVMTCPDELSSLEPNIEQLLYGSLISARWD